MTGGTQWRRWGEGAAPCQGCTERTASPNCHGMNEDGSYRCERYGAFKARRDEELSVRREVIKMNDTIGEVLRGARKGKQ